MVIYIDNEYKCYATPAEGLRPFDDVFFNGKCAAFIEGYRCVPEGETWTRSDGVKFEGKMITPWKDSREFEAAQAEYENELFKARVAELEKELAAAKILLGVE